MKLASAAKRVQPAPRTPRPTKPRTMWRPGRITEHRDSWRDPLSSVRLGPMNGSGHAGLSRERPRWGYRRAHVELADEGWLINRKRVQRVWREEGLRVPQRRQKAPAARDWVIPHPRGGEPRKLENKRLSRHRLAACVKAGERTSDTPPRTPPCVGCPRGQALALRVTDLAAPRDIRPASDISRSEGLGPTGRLSVRFFLLQPGIRHRFP